MAGVGAKDIKRRIKSVQNTMQITKAMELVASSKLRKGKEKVEHSRPYFRILKETMQKIAMNTKGLKSPFLEKREEVKNRGYIVIAGDRGLAGGYNSNVLKTVLGHMDGKKEKIIAIGRKSVEFFEKRDYEMVGSYMGIAEDLEYGVTNEIATIGADLYKSGDIDELYIVYTEFVSTISQQPQIIKLLPMTMEKDKSETEAEKRGGLVIYEPSEESVFGTLVPKYLSGVLFGTILESYASEQGARRTAMESANDNAEEMISSLELKYNRARQASITQEISEIVAGAEALK